MDWDIILGWVDRSPTLAGIVATVVGSILVLLVTSAVMALVKARKPSFEWVRKLTMRAWAFRPTTMARLNDAVKIAKTERFADRNVTANTPPNGAPAPSPTVSRPRGVQFAPGHGPHDLEARIRASDQRFVVSYRNGAEIGIVTPTRGLFMAQHLRKGEAGPFDSMQEAMYALWELD